MRPGQRAERWLKENSNLQPTCASGAKFEDADFLSKDRIYEVKSSEMNSGIRIDKKHIMVLFQRSKKLLRDPVFIYMNKEGSTYALVPLHVFVPEAARNPRDWVKLDLDPPIITSKGNSISVKEHQLKEVSFVNFGVLKYETGNGIQWVICDATYWLELVGEAVGDPKGN